MALPVSRRIILGIATVLIAGTGYFWYQHQQTNKAVKTWVWNLPAHFPVPRIPADNAMSEEKFQLGRQLFYDKRLSGNGTFACASCHLQNLAFTDGKAVATGSTGMHTLRSAQPLANSAYHPFFTWANFSLFSMERQMINPLLGENPVEMGVNDGVLPEILGRLKTDANYPQQFKSSFPESPDAINLENIVKAISVFQRGMISANSKYDQSLAHKVALTENEERGRALFFSDKAQCSQCHGSFNFNDQVIDANTAHVDMKFHNTGLYNLDGNGSFPTGNGGIFELTGKQQDIGMFRAASLRNVAVTAPYMHDGSIANLEQVLDFYAGHGREIADGPNKGDGRKNPLKDKRVDLIQLNAQDKVDIIAFLKTLTDEEFLTNPRYSNPFEAKVAIK